MEEKDGYRLGNCWWWYWPLSDCCGHLWPFVEVGANGSMAIHHGGHSWVSMDHGDGPLWLFINLGVGHLLIVVRGPCGNLSILVVGPVDISGPLSSSIDPGGGSSWLIIDGCGGCSLCL